MTNHPIDVRALRESLNWSQGDLARYLEVERSSVSRIERGQKIPGPTRKLLDVLAKRVRHRGTDAA